MRNALLTGLFVCATFTIFTDAKAATLYFDQSNTSLYPGDTMTLSLRIDPDEGECINVVDGVILFSDNITPIDVSTGNSILPLWVEQPVINRNTGEVTFAGGIPNGYCGRIAGDPRLTNVIFEIVLQAPGLQIGMGEQNASATISFAPSTQVLLNDNAGTQAPLRTIPAEVFVHSKPNNQIDNAWGDRVSLDTVPPSEFSIILTSDSSIYAGQYFIAFNTTDKQSGIDHYEVMEEPIGKIGVFDWGGVNAPWKPARSPYKLTDQTLNSVVRVRAVDKAGNEYVAVYVPPEDMRIANASNTMGLLLWGVPIVLIVIISALWFYLRRSRKYTEQTDVTEILID